MRKGMLYETAVFPPACAALALDFEHAFLPAVVDFLTQFPGAKYQPQHSPTAQPKQQLDLAAVAVAAAVFACGEPYLLLPELFDLLLLSFCRVQPGHLCLAEDCPLHSDIELTIDQNGLEGQASDGPDYREFLDHSKEEVSIEEPEGCYN